MKYWRDGDRHRLTRLVAYRPHIAWTQLEDDIVKGSELYGQLKHTVIPLKKSN